MASLSDLSAVYAQAAPAGFKLADLGIQGTLSKKDAQIAQNRLVRNVGQRAIPDLINNQAARGAYNSSATVNKANRTLEDAGDTLSDLVSRGANTETSLATNALLAQTGISI